MINLQLYLGRNIATLLYIKNKSIGEWIDSKKELLKTTHLIPRDTRTQIPIELQVLYQIFRMDMVIKMKLNDEYHYLSIDYEQVIGLFYYFSYILERNPPYQYTIKIIC